MRAFIWILAFIWLADAIILFAGLRAPTNIGSGISKGIVALFLADMARTIGDKKKTAKFEKEAEEIEQLSSEDID
jgi:hypothetical protein